MPPSAAAPTLDAVIERVLGIVRALAREVGGARAERAVAPEASLEREGGLGSPERGERGAPGGGPAAGGGGGGGARGRSPTAASGVRRRRWRGACASAGWAAGT